MSRSIPSHRRPNDLFLINLKQKLHLEIHHPTHCPTCVCGQQIDPHSMHIFCCQRVSKMLTHHRTRDGAEGPLGHLLITAGIISSKTQVENEPKRTVPSLSNARPHDLAWRPSTSAKLSHAAPPPHSRCGIDITITPPKGHRPPSRRSANPHKSAPAAKHLIDKERLKLMRDGMCDTTNNNTLTGEQIIGELLDTGQVLLPWTISPHGRFGPMFRRFLYGESLGHNYTFPATRPNAARMFNRAMFHPSTIGLVPLATAAWKRNKSPKQHFFGNSWTCPTPLEYAQQKFGLAYSNAKALHVRDAKRGTLVEVTDSANEEEIDPTATPDTEPDFYCPPGFFQPHFPVMPSTDHSIVESIALSTAPISTIHTSRTTFTSHSTHSPSLFSDSWPQLVCTEIDRTRN